jgi:outer membrane protein TolC
MINPGFAWDILNYGRLISTVNVNDARFQELAYNYQQLVLSANAEVESAINNFLNAQERLKAAEEAVAASVRSVEIIELQSEKGAVDMNRVFILQRALVTDQERLAITRGEVALYLIAAYKAIGGGWEIRNGGTMTTVTPLEEPAAAPVEAEPAEAAPSPTETVPAPADMLDTSTESSKS